MSDKISIFFSKLLSGKSRVHLVTVTERYTLLRELKGLGAESSLTRVDERNEGTRSAAHALRSYSYALPHHLTIAKPPVEIDCGTDAPQLFAASLSAVTVMTISAPTRNVS